MIIHNPILTGSFTVNGTDVASITSSAASIASLNSYTASLNARSSSFATTGSNTFVGNQVVSGSLTVTGSITTPGTLTAQTLVVQTITSSVSVITGSTNFGSSVTLNNHLFTGSVSVTGSLAVVTTGTELQVNANGVNIGNALTDIHIVSGSLRIAGPVTSSGALLNGALNGTSATFSSSVTATDATFSNGGASPQLILNTSTATTPTAWTRYNKNGVFKWDVGMNVGGLTSDQFSFYSTSNVFVIQQNGNVGIGTDSPTELLEVRSAPGAEGGIRITARIDGSVASPKGSYFSFRSGTTPVETARIQSNNAFANESGGNLIFSTGNSSNVLTERMRITSGGNVLINTTTSNGIRLGEKLSVASTTDYAGIAINTYAGANAGRSSVIDLNKSRGTSDGSMTAVQNGDEVGYLLFRGSDGTNFVDGGFIRGVVDGTVSSNSVPVTMQFFTGPNGSTERMRITGGGYLKAANNGTYESSTGTYHEFNSNTNGNVAITIRHTGTTNLGGIAVKFPSASPNNTSDYFIACNDSTNDKAIIYSSGTYGSRTGTYGSIVSDIRYKENILEATPKLNDIMKLRVVNYNFIDDKTIKQIGFIAQEMEEVFPSLVFKNDTRKYDDDGNLISGFEDARGLKVGMEFAILVKAIQELTARVQQLENK